MDSLPTTIRNKLKYYSTEDWKQHIVERTLIHPITGCWIWQKAILKPSKVNPAAGGYGMMLFYEKGKPKMRLVHTVTYQLWVGPIPPGRDICHHDRLCNNKACCNPDHLYAGTTQQNVRDAISKGVLDPGIATRGKHIYTDGTTRAYFVDGEQPDGWKITNPSNIVTFVYTDGKERAKFEPGKEPAGWVRAYKAPGSTTGSKWYTNGQENVLVFPGHTIPGEGWRPGVTQQHKKGTQLYAQV